MTFAYTNTELDELDNSISLDRLSRYVRMAKGDRKKAILFYEMNNAVSESLFGVIRGFEVALRNSVHNVLHAGIGHPDWYDRVPQFGRWERLSIGKAKIAIRKSRKQVTAPRVISELTLGFWCGLTSKTYDALLWVPHLHKAFPHIRIGRRAANARLEQIRQVRNRIAHHECILHYDLAQEYKDVIEATRWICPITASWVDTTSTFQSRLIELANLISPQVVIAVSPAVPVNPAAQGV